MITVKFKSPEKLIKSHSNIDLRNIQRFITNFEHKYLSALVFNRSAYPNIPRHNTDNYKFFEYADRNLAADLDTAKIYNPKALNLESLAECLANSGWYIRFKNRTVIFIYAECPDGYDKYLVKYNEKVIKEAPVYPELRNQVFMAPPQRGPFIDAIQNVNNQRVNEIIERMAQRNADYRAFDAWGNPQGAVGAVEPQPAIAAVPGQINPIILDDILNEEEAEDNIDNADLPANYEPRF